MTWELMRMSKEKTTGLFGKVRFEYFGLLGCGIISACCVITAIGFTGYVNEGYSLLNHFISELGMYTESPLSWVFNVGLIIGAPLIMVFLVGMRTIMTSKIATLGAIIGIATGVGGFFVGIFPADVNLGGHGIAAMTFFFGGAVTVFVISIAIARQKEIKLAKWLTIVGMVDSACFVLFLVDVFSVSTGVSNMSSMGAALASARPAPFWSIPFLEWLPMIFMLAWLFLAAVDSLKRNAK
jgi:hypothetical membrane protein